MDIEAFIKLLIDAEDFSADLLETEVLGLPSSKEIILALCEKDQFIRLIKGRVHKAEISLLVGELFDQLFRYNRSKDYLREQAREFLKKLEEELVGKIAPDTLTGSIKSKDYALDSDYQSTFPEPPKSAKIDSENNVIAMLSGCKSISWLSSSNYSDDEIEHIFDKFKLTRMECQVTCFRHALMGKPKEDFSTISMTLYGLDAAPMVQKIYSEALVKLSQFEV